MIYGTLFDRVFYFFTLEMEGGGAHGLRLPYSEEHCRSSPMAATVIKAVEISQIHCCCDAGGSCFNTEIGIRFSDHLVLNI